MFGSCSLLTRLVSSMFGVSFGIFCSGIALMGDSEGRGYKNFL